MKMVDLKCENCGKKFERSKSHARSGIKNNWAVACGLSCGVSLGHKKRDKESYSGPSYDEFSPFRLTLRRIKARAKKSGYGEVDITVLFLKELWESQKGICPYSGNLMVLPENDKQRTSFAPPELASLDRIDSEKGYIQGNVEYVCYAVNLAKNRFTKEQMLVFFNNKN